MLRDLLDAWRQRASPLSLRARARLPAASIFAIRHNRFVTLLFHKAMYWFFKARNRLEVLGSGRLREAIRAGGPFMVVANHSGTADVALQQSILAHHDVISFAFINGEGFIARTFPVVAATLHFAEYIPRMGAGKQSVGRVVKRLVAGDRVVYFPEGSFDFGLVWHGYTGVARIALEYRKATGRPLRLVPACTIGMHEAYNPHTYLRRRPFRRHNHGRKHGHKHDPEFIAARRKRLGYLPASAQIHRPRQKLVVKYGPAFASGVPDSPGSAGLEAATDAIMLRVASLWGQKRLRPNMSRAWIQRALPLVDGQRLWRG
ncbi:MAG: 1-acyl-sn-glycerol-3-phosphate acyltransferase [Candidatus Lokiarchaeota archaeon]|nr:1-acyl-sn-glycerol-3-phosphate acyltransferase [Candidatus Lokiarchaeota archaeon]